MDLLNKRDFVDREDILFQPDTGKYFKFQQKSGVSEVCDVQGHPIPSFRNDFSGTVTTLERKEHKGRWNDIEVLHTIKDIPGYIGRPAKYVGHSIVPRPGVKMSAGSDECPYTIPTYLEPIPPKLGRVSVRRAKKQEKKVKKKERGPSIVAALESQFAPSLSMHHFCKKTFPALRDDTEVQALLARNKATIMSDGIDLMAELRKFRSSTAGTFGQQNPPYDPLMIKKRETARDSKVNPKKHALIEEEYLTDRQSVEERRRTRYIQFFKEKDEAERAAMLAGEE